MIAELFLPLCLAALPPFQDGAGTRIAFSLSATWEGRVEAQRQLFLDGLPGGGPSTGWTRIPIPSVFEERQVFAENAGIVFLRCPFVFDRELSSARRYRLRFERVVEACHVWMNGADAGIHTGGDTPFSLDVTGLVVRGPNLLQMAVSRELTGLPNEQPPVGAVLGDVVLEEVSPWTVEDFTCQYLPSEGEGVVELGLEVASTAATAEALRARFEIFTPAGGDAVVSAELEFPVEARSRSMPSARVKIPSPARWGLKTPHLYTAKVTLMRGGAAVDVKLTKFGLRKVEIVGTQFLLNGEAVKLRCATDAGYETGTFLRPTPLFDSRRKVKILKDSGFNAIRVPGRLAPRSLIENANELGLLVIAEPAIRGGKAAVLPALTLAGWVPLPVFDRRAPGEAAARILEAQIRRDRNDPSVVWWGIGDGSLELVKSVHALDADALVSRHAVFAGTNYYLAPGVSRRVPYLRPEARFDGPGQFGDTTWLLDLGDRGEFTFVVLDFAPSLTEFDRVLAGLGGESWRLEARVLAPRAARMKDAFTRDRLGVFFDSPSAMVQESALLRGEFQRRVMEAARVNVNVGGVCVNTVSDSPWSAGQGLVDWFGRPTPSQQLAIAANAPRRAVVMPERRSGETSLTNGLVESCRILFGQLVDTPPPIQILQVECRRPDEVSGYSPCVSSARFPYLVETEIGFGGGPGIYVVHPLWIGLVDHVVEQVGLVGVDVPNQPLTLNGPPVVNPVPHLTYAGDVGDLWQDENRFMEVAAGLERAREGGTTALFFALTPENPLVELGCLPPMILTSGAGRFHAISGDPVFEKAGLRGGLGDPLNELKPRYTMAGLAAAEPWSVAIDNDGVLAGVNLARVSHGKGSLILTTMPMAESFKASAASRRVMSNLVGILGKEPSVKIGSTPMAAARLEDLRLRYRERKASRGN